MWIATVLEEVWYCIKQYEILFKIAINLPIQALFTASRAVCEWAMKFNEKYVGLIRQTKQRAGVCVLVFRGLFPAEKKIGLFWAAASGPI